MEKRSLSERDICTKFITPALCSAGWDEITQIREEVSFTQGRIIVRSKPVMALCDQLEASLTTTIATRSRLLNALLREALEPAAAPGSEAAE